ncbi:MAG: ligase-associated DNA damage response exonuclease, partial [Pseudomonadota bacterium]
MAIAPESLLRPEPAGLYCPPGDFYIDPVRPVERALITHGHADHARPGHQSVMATDQTLKIMGIRYGENHASSTQAVEWGEVQRVGDVDVTFHPAGHVLGSAQICVEWKGLRIVASGDYKVRPDPTCQPFEPVPCHVFITEATFGLPVFTHPPASHEIGKLLRSLEQFPERAHMVGAYALGKAQRIIRLLRDAGYQRPIYIHGAMKKLCDFYEQEGIALGELRDATIEKGNKDQFAGEVIVATPSAFADKWARRFPDPMAVFCSGWMMVR